MSTWHLNQLVRKSDIPVVCVLFAVVAILAGARSVHYLLFHTLAELFAIVVSLSIFIMTWTSKRYLANGYLILLGGAYGAIGVVDVFHTMTFRGMNLFPGVSTNYPTQFWLTARYLEAIALLCGPLVIGKRPNFYYVSAGFAAIAAVACVAVMYQWFPATFIDGVGLTPFKIYSEYVIIAMLMVGFIMLYRFKRQFEPRIFFLLVSSLWLAVATEFCFTKYVGFYDFINELGHYFRFLSVALAFIAIVLSGVRQPLELVFREMDEHKRKLDELNKKLSDSEDRLKRAQGVAKVGSWYRDIPGNVQTWSAETYRMFGEPVGTAITFEAFANHIHPDDLESVIAAWDLALQGQAYDIEHRIVVGEQIRWVREIAEVTFAEDGSPLAGLGTVQDITERKQAEEELRFDSSILKSLAEGIYLVRVSDGVIVFANPQCKRIFGYGSGELIGKHVSIVNAPGAQNSETVANEIKAELKRTGMWSGEVLNIKKDGTTFWCHANVTAFDHSQYGQVWVFVHEDITERKRAEEQIHNLAFHDSLTRLPNRRLLSDRLGQTMAASKRSGCYGALIFLDLDNFKSLNDTHGHNVGDLLLIEVANRLKKCVREMDTVARFGGDEFVVTLSELSSDQAKSTLQAEIVAEKIRITLSEPYLLTIKHGGKADTTLEHHCTVSIGVALFINHDASQDDILKWADTAMYQAKKAGYNLIRFMTREYE